jgi:hypothetical protein
MLATTYDPAILRERKVYVPAARAAGQRGALSERDQRRQLTRASEVDATSLVGHGGGWGGLAHFVVIR